MVETALSSLVVIAFLWGDDIMDLLHRMVGTPRTVLSKRQTKKLIRQHNEALDILREIDAYDRFAANPLPTEIHDRLGTFLTQHKGKAALPQREEAARDD